MKADAREPCKTCPYRKDVPPKTWHRSEFENLLRQDANEAAGATFGCHQTNRMPRDSQSLCIGWLLDQRERNCPSIQLRLLLMKDDAAAVQMEESHPPTGVDLYPSINAMCRANGVRPRRPR